ncbi:MAG: ATPase [Candidatus Magasanikbacteria bacterium CG10_big_fil_rev_8_21_14_0_10_47_10]|uniref:ATPase n=1 Tax=Candidatus Magasanikbacteria bacterium CG10_big_fil_rev_8_21_14_0_10_47_10 TaxID=1974652 RepID=A0A2H0TRC3_9BACT|nr:MAG: ATPase [Candidatus Magasanikbacteria bacterium CG10_big_fil_rev_8_21_14_0_10_47_10]
MQYHAKSITQVLRHLQTNGTTGLTKMQVEKLESEHGVNKLPQAGIHFSRVKIFFDQWKSPLIIILLIAGVVSWLLGETLDALIILITAAINGFIGFFQEDKANRALKQLQSMVTFHALVLRDGVKKSIASSELVPGDIVYVNPGDKVQADGRLIEAHVLEVNEAPLTGESEPIKKHASEIDEGTILADRTNMLFRGTVIENGKGLLVVTAIGGQTEIGRIATLVQETSDERTPLQQQLKLFGQVLGAIVVAIALCIVLIGIFFRPGEYGLLELFETAVAVAVAAIPEGLVISLTVILAVGMQHILKKNALVRRLVSAETLGSVSVICTDKTGTLTEGKMALTQIISADGQRDVRSIDGKNNGFDFASRALQISVLCNEGILSNPADSEQEWLVYGDSTDTALIRAGMTLGFEKDQLEIQYKRIGEIPFSSLHKYVVTLNEMENGKEMLMKGAPEIVLSRAAWFEKNGKKTKMTKKQHVDFIRKANDLAAKGYRILAVGHSSWNNDQTEITDKDVQDITFVALLALSDPLRKDVKMTMQRAQKAGIRVIMITGDHANTAQSIAKELGLPAGAKNILQGKDIDKITDDELEHQINQIFIFARVNPEHKIRIVRALQKNGEVVAMTGDGVNDAPALKGADIGVSVGSGTDVARETSDMVLLDDNFSTIVAAIEEGRRIYQNIKKVVLYLLSSSFAEVVLIAGSLIAGLPLAVLPAQILWVNIIEDSFPNMALAFDKGDKENMSDPPRKKDEALIDREMKLMIAIISIVSNLVLLGLFIYFYKTTGNIALSRTLMFVGLAIDSLLYIYSVRSLRHMIWQINPFNNSYLTGAAVFGWCMLLSAVYLPVLQVLLKTVPLSVHHWIIMALFGMLNVGIIEIIKWIFITKHKTAYAR